MPANNAPIFIIGNPRSGTTLLRLMLTCHPRIVIPPEAGFLIQLQKEHGGFRGGAEALDHFVAALLASPKFEYWKLPEPVLRRALAEAKPGTYAALIAAVYVCYASVHQPGKPRWGDKNNHYLAYIETIASLFPDARFVHIVRDGRDVACSYRSLADVKGEYAPRLPSDVFEAVFDWNRNLARIRRSFARVGWKRAHELRYEDLVREPESVLRRVCEFLGEEYSPAMLEYDRENRERELEPRDFDAWKRKNRDGVDLTAVGRWERELSAEEKALAQMAGATMLRQYRYATPTRANVRVRAKYVQLAFQCRARRWMRRFRLIRPTSSSS
jgi:hypothetical protein